MLQHVAYIKNNNSDPNFVFIDIYISCECPFPSEPCLVGNLENILLSLASRLERYLKAWDLPQNGKLDSSPAPALTGNGFFTVLLKRTRDQIVEKPFQERGRTPCCLRNVEADLTKPWRICSWGQFGIGRQVAGLPWDILYASMKGGQNVYFGFRV